LKFNIKHNLFLVHGKELEKISYKSGFAKYLSKLTYFDKYLANSFKIKLNIGFIGY
jgi:hypothetical protein